MAWYSILPADFFYVESWAARVFVFLGLVTIFPWAALLLFDLALYLWRMVIYEIPVVGGRARGMQRPHAPSLNERADAPRQVFGLAGYEDGDRAKGHDEDDGVKRRNPRDHAE